VGRALTIELASTTPIIPLHCTIGVTVFAVKLPSLGNFRYPTTLHVDAAVQQIGL